MCTLLLILVVQEPHFLTAGKEYFHSWRILSLDFVLFWVMLISVRTISRSPSSINNTHCRQLWPQFLRKNYLHQYLFSLKILIFLKIFNKARTEFFSKPKKISLLSHRDIREKVITQNWYILYIMVDPNNLILCWYLDRKTEAEPRSNLSTHLQKTILAKHCLM